MKRLKHKYGAKACEDDGLRFDSLKERRYYRKLKIMVQAGEVVMFLRQVPFDLPGGQKYRADFLVFYADDTVAVVDVKGYRTKTFIAKKKQVEALYPVTIEEV